MANTDRLIDLDAAAAARAAELGEAPAVKWKGETYQLPPEMPARFLDYIVGDDFAAAFAELFPDGSFDVGAFLDAAALGDLMEFANGIARVYGLEGDLGNLRRSGGSSSNTSSR